MRIQHNISALNAHRQYGNNNTAVSSSLEKLSSGYRINKAGDDAAGLAISEKMRAQIKGLDTAQKNAQDGISLIQTAEGALTEVHSMLNRMTELATQSANGTYDNETDRDNLQKEVESLKKEINRISDGTNYNGIKLLDGKLGGYKGGAIAASTGLYEADPMVVTGGNLTSGAIVGVTANTTGSANLSGVTIMVNGAATKVTISATANDTVSYVTVSEPKAGEKGTTTWKLVVNKDKASAQEYEQLNDLEVSFTTGGSGTATAAQAVSFTVTPDADGNVSGGLRLQIGEDAQQYNQVNVVVGQMDTKSLGIDDIDIGTQDGAKAALDKIKKAINKVSSTRGDLGALQNRLDHTINNLGVASENMTAAESRIRDVDMAKEMMDFTKNNILTQASQAMLAQANQLPQGVLQLLQ